MSVLQSSLKCPHLLPGTLSPTESPDCLGPPKSALGNTNCNASCVSENAGSESAEVKSCFSHHDRTGGLEHADVLGTVALPRPSCHQSSAAHKQLRIARVVSSRVVLITPQSGPLLIPNLGWSNIGRTGEAVHSSQL